MSLSDDYKKFFLEISNEISLTELAELGDKYKEVLDIKTLDSLEDLELFLKVQSRQHDIVHSFIDKWNKAYQPSDKELRIALDYTIKTANQSELERMKKDSFIKFTNKEKEIDNVKEKATRNHEKLFEMFTQPNQVSQPTSPKNQNSQPSNKDNYPWTTIISMGAVIAALLGMIVFLLIKNKNKKRVK